MADEEHGGTGGGEDGTPRRKMTVRWGKAVYEDVEPGDVPDAPAEAATTEEGQGPPTHPPSESASPQWERKTGERREDIIRRERRLRIALGLGVATILVLLIQIWADRYDPFVISEPPPSIVGTWVTDDPRYAGRSFVISEEVFELRLGEDGNHQFDIRTIRETETEDSWMYEITYISPDGDLVHSFFLHADGTVRVRNPPDIVWTRLPNG